MKKKGELEKIVVEREWPVMFPSRMCRALVNSNATQLLQLAQTMCEKVFNLNAMKSKHLPCIAWLIHVCSPGVAQWTGKTSGTALLGPSSGPSSSAELQVVLQRELLQT